MATSREEPFHTLQNQQYMNLITFRKNGQPVSTPVWFVERNGRLYVVTSGETGKVKRIRNNGRVEVGPSDRRGKPLGPTVAAQARVLPASDGQVPNNLLNQKYGLQKRLIDLIGVLARSSSKRVFLEIAHQEAL